MKSGLSTVPGDSATARAAATASRLAAPTTELPNRRGPARALSGSRHRSGRAQATQPERGDPPQRLEHPRPGGRSRGVKRDAAEAQRIIELEDADDQLPRKLLFVVLDDERH